MQDGERSTRDVVRARVGSTITRVRRVHYEFQGSLDRASGDIELWFGDLVLWFRCAPNGQDLRVDDEAWQFALPLTAENEAFVRTSGHHIPVDVTAESPYKALVDHVVDTVEPILDQWQHLVGVRVLAGAVTLRIYVDGDELFVMST